MCHPMSQSIYIKLYKVYNFLPLFLANWTYVFRHQFFKYMFFLFLYYIREKDKVKTTIISWFILILFMAKKYKFLEKLLALTLR